MLLLLVLLELLLLALGQLVLQLLFILDVLAKLLIQLLLLSDRHTAIVILIEKLLECGVESLAVCVVAGWAEEEVSVGVLVHLLQEILGGGVVVDHFHLPQIDLACLMRLGLLDRPDVQQVAVFAHEVGWQLLLRFRGHHRIRRWIYHLCLLLRRCKPTHLMPWPEGP